MMKPLPLIALAMMHVLAQASVEAQALAAPGTVTLPPDPIIVRATATAVWRINYTSDVSAVGARAKRSKAQLAVARVPVIQHIVVAKDGNTYHEKICYDIGVSTDIWWVDGTQVTQHSGEKNFSISLPSGADNLYQDFRKCDFPDVEWIRASNFQSMDRVKGVKCFAFRKKISLLPPNLLQSLPPDQTQGSMVEATAWINVATRLPVRYAYKGQTETYLFDQSPATPLTVPPEVTQAIAEFQASKAESLRPAPRP